MAEKAPGGLACARVLVCMRVRTSSRAAAPAGLENGLLVCKPWLSPPRLRGTRTHRTERPRHASGTQSEAAQPQEWAGSRVCGRLRVCAWEGGGGGGGGSKFQSSCLWSSQLLNKALDGALNAVPLRNLKKTPTLSNHLYNSVCFRQMEMG